MQLDFSGKIAIVTGAAAGIGRATTQALLEAGAEVWLADINEPLLEKTAATLREAGLKSLHTRHCDMRDPDQADALVEAAVQAAGRLDVMVNNVGISHFERVEKIKTSDWKAIQDVTLNSCFYGLRAALAPMCKQKYGAVVNISSGAGLRGVRELAAYGSAKAAMINLTQTAAVENAEIGVRVNCIAPGTIETAAVRNWLKTFPNEGDDFRKGQLMKRLGRPEEIAAAVLFLASDQASFISGATLAVDGAVSARLAGGLK